MGKLVSRWGHVRLVLLTIAVTVVVAVPTAVWASHQFNDVATNHPFHKEISAIADAGIATGFNDGGFHPSANVTRQAMAAFLERGIGRVGFTRGQPLTLPLTPTFTTLTGVRIDAGAEGSGSGFVQLIGTADFYAGNPSTCPCNFELHLFDLETESILAFTSFDLNFVENETGGARSTGTVQTVVPVSAATTRRFGLKAVSFDSNTEIVASGAISAHYVPFGPAGSDSLFHCSDEMEPNDSIAAAQPYVGPAAYGCIDPVLDHDYYRVVVPDDYAVQIRTEGTGGAGTCETDTYISLRTSSGFVVDEDHDSGAGTCSAIYTIGLPGDVFFIQVRGEGVTGTTTGTYRLVVTMLPPGP